MSVIESMPCNEVGLRVVSSIFVCVFYFNSTGSYASILDIIMLQLCCPVVNQDQSPIHLPPEFLIIFAVDLVGSLNSHIWMAYDRSALSVTT